MTDGSSRRQSIDFRSPCSALVFVFGFVLLTLVSKPVQAGAFLPWTVNPTGYLDGAWYIFLYLSTIPGKEILNVILNHLASSVFGFKKMDESDGKVHKLEVLETVDLCYLAFNTIMEFLGMNHVVACLINGPVEQRLQAFNVINGPVAFVVIMCLNDIIYYPFHLIAHKRAFYPYCHKQHHRNFVPFRGYADAANQHPFEQFYGFIIFITSVHLAAMTVGVHAGTAWFAFLAWAVLNIANHLAFDSMIHLPLPYPAYPHDHQMHHRFPQCNYSTLTTMCDRAFGTFQPYKDLANSAEKKSFDSSRPEALPSAWSVVLCATCIGMAAIVVEVIHSGTVPQAEELASLVNMSFLAIAVASGFTVVQSVAKLKVG